MNNTNHRTTDSAKQDQTGRMCRPISFNKKKKKTSMVANKAAPQTGIKANNLSHNYLSLETILSDKRLDYR